MSPCNEDGQNIALLNRVGSRTNDAKCREFDPQTYINFLYCCMWNLYIF